MTKLITSSNWSEWKRCKTEGCEHIVGNNDYCFAHDEGFKDRWPALNLFPITKENKAALRAIKEGE